MSTSVPLFERMPEIYRTRDAEQAPAGQLRAFLDAIGATFGALHDDVAQLYDNLFIDTCDDWAIPYIADLLGTTYLKGDQRTLRADVADTIALRRRKGSLGAIERLATNLTGWTCRAVELRENLGWTQHLNHQRPDAGGGAPLAKPGWTRFDIPRGGTAPIRDPARLALLGTPFDSFAYTADVKPALDEARHINLPNLAVFLWRLVAYRMPRILPIAKGRTDLGAQPPGVARFVLRFDLHPLDLPVRLFNLGSTGAPIAGIAPLTLPDAVPGPMLDARLTTGSAGGDPDAYVRIDIYQAAVTPPAGFDLGDVAGLTLFVPDALPPFLPADWRWTTRGDNLCAWETGLRRPAAVGEIVVDPAIGRVLIGLDGVDQADAMMPLANGTPVSRLFASFTYGMAGPVGGHPVTRVGPPDPDPVDRRIVGDVAGGTTLRDALIGLATASDPVLIEIQDSLTHTLDLGSLPDTGVDGTVSLQLAQPLILRAAAGQRPIVRLARPLSLRPVDAQSVPTVRLEGLYLAPDPETFPAGSALIDRAAVERLEIVGCTLAPGGHSLRDGSRAPIQPALHLADGYGFADPNEENAFAPTPDIIVQRSITGPIAIDPRYRLDISDSVVDAGLGFGDAPSGVFAIAAATDPANGWSARLDFSGITVFGPVRTEAVGGLGGIFSQRFEVLDNQHGCIKWTCFSGDTDRLPPNHFCIDARSARILFTSERFNDPGYAQLSRKSDRRAREEGPDDDAMGAFGFTLETHKWANLQVRLGEFMPVGVRPLSIAVT